ATPPPPEHAPRARTPAATRARGRKARTGDPPGRGDSDRSGCLPSDPELVHPARPLESGAYAGSLPSRIRRLRRILAFSLPSRSEAVVIGARQLIIGFVRGPRRVPTEFTHHFTYARGHPLPDACSAIRDRVG